MALGFMRSPHYLEAEGMWMLPCPEGASCEVVVHGSVAAPDASRLALVHSAMTALNELLVKAVAYLDEFVDRQKLGVGEWYFEGIESGRLNEAEVQFEEARSKPIWLSIFVPLTRFSVPLDLRPQQRR